MDCLRYSLNLVEKPTILAGPTSFIFLQFMNQNFRTYFTKAEDYHPPTLYPQHTLGCMKVHMRIVEKTNISKNLVYSINNGSSASIHSGSHISCALDITSCHHTSTLLFQFIYTKSDLSCRQKYRAKYSLRCNFFDLMGGLNVWLMH